MRPSNPFARNPYATFPDAMRLVDFGGMQAGDTIIVYWYGSDLLWFRTLDSSKLIEESKDVAVAVVPRSGPEPLYSDRLSLHGIGIIPNWYDEWAPAAFTVKADYNSIRHFYRWLVEQDRPKSANAIASRWPTWYATPKNPVYSGTATRDELPFGTELLTVSHSGIALMSADIVDERACWRDEGHLWRLGILCSPEFGWDPETVSIVNTPENRKELVAWLIKLAVNRRCTAYNTAKMIVGEYPEEFQDHPVALARKAAPQRLAT